MSKIRIVAALALTAGLIWHDVVVNGKGIVASALQILLPVALFLLGRSGLPLLYARSRTIVLTVAILLCIAINFSQLYIHEKWIEPLAFGATLGIMLTLVTCPKWSEDIRKP